MSTVIFYSETTDGFLEYADANYFTAQEASIAEVKYTTGGIRIGQWVPSDYVFDRGFIYFDTSGLGSVIITSVTLDIVLDDDESDTNFGVVVMNGQPIYPHDTLEVEDYDIDHYSGNGGETNTEDKFSGVITITFNYLGRSWINKTGTTKLALISSRDINQDAPSENEYIKIYDGDQGQTVRKPKLTITYYTETGIPAVTTDAASNIKGTKCQANCNITNIGGVSIEFGFEYGETEESIWAKRKTVNITSTGTRYLTLSGLKPETTYYYRAFVVNDYGIAYGDWVSFTTTALPSYGIYEESNAATICFYVRKIGGKWSIKHGPYTTDQADIKITDILTEGTGKYQIKFESDVLTGLSASIMCKLDVKVRG